MLKFLKFALIISTCVLRSLIQADCSDLSQSECEYWTEYCQWNSEQNICEEIGGGGGSSELGPYEVATYSQNLSLIHI